MESILDYMEQDVHMNLDSLLQIVKGTDFTFAIFHQGYHISDLIQYCSLKTQTILYICQHMLQKIVHLLILHTLRCPEYDV